MGVLYLRMLSSVCKLGMNIQVDRVIEPTHRVLIEDVRDAVGDLVDVIKTYRSKGRIARVMVSTLFRRRQEEAEAVIEAAISRLHVSVSTSYEDKLYHGQTHW